MLGLSPDGSRVLALTSTPSDLVVYPTGTGERTVLSRGRSRTYLLMGAWFPDGERILTCGSEKGRGPRCYEQRVGGSPKAVTPEGLVGAPRCPWTGGFSSVGTRIAHGRSSTLRAERCAPRAGLQPTDAARVGATTAVPRSSRACHRFPPRLERVNLRTGVRTLDTRARSARSRWCERHRSDQHHRRRARIRVFLRSRRRDVVRRPRHRSHPLTEGQRIAIDQAMLVPD